MEFKLTNFTGMDDPTNAYRTQIGMASIISGPHPEFTAGWIGGNLEVQAQIYDDTGSGSVVWPLAPTVYKQVIPGLTPADTVLTLRIVCNSDYRPGKLDFEYNLNDTTWVGFATYDIPSGSAFMSFPARFPYIDLRAESSGATTISFSGWVKTSPNWPATDGMQPAVGAQVSAFSPSSPSTPLCTATVDPTTGAFTLTGIPQSTTFNLAILPPTGYMPVLSKFIN